jgi:ATP-dependent Clp protease ATP-binding subunit ClpA
MAFERWTERARQVVVLAQEEARQMGHQEIGSEHILLGLLREQEGLAARALETLGINVDGVRAEVARVRPSGESKPSGQLPFTPHGEKVCDFALREALSLGCNYIGTEHVLLGLVRENEGVGARILLALDADSEKVRNEVIRLLTGQGIRPALKEMSPGTRLDQRVIDALPDLRRAAGKLQGNAEIVVRQASNNGNTKPLVVIRRGPDGEGRLYVTGEVLHR